MSAAFPAAFVLAVFVCICAGAQTVADRYTKHEKMITMRDGIKLYTAIYVPKDSSKKFPILMERTPYSCRPYGTNAFPQRMHSNPLILQDGYIFVFQDVRGRYRSEGQFEEMTPNIPANTNTQTDESSDTYDTIEWLLNNLETHNGHVGITGISYPGFYTTAALPDAHPALKAASPQAPVTDEFEGDDAYHRGAFFLLDNVNFLNVFDRPRTGPTESYDPLSTQLRNTNAYDFYLRLGPIKNINAQYFDGRSKIWNEYLQHATKDGYWKSRNIRPHLTNIKPAVLITGGWFDAENLFGALKTYEALKQKSPATNKLLVMGPWTHGAWARPTWSNYATYQFGRNTNEAFQTIEASFFRMHLHGIQPQNKPPGAVIYFTGSNQWRTFPAWPPSGTQNASLYLRSGNYLSNRPEPSRQGDERYVSDPANPVPYSPAVSGYRDNNYMGADQRFLKDRNDVLHFATDTLANPVTLAGPVVARLFVSLTGTDADFVVKLIDVHPNGTESLVRAEVLRGKFRNSFEKPEPFVPEKITAVKLELNDVAHTFLAGHRIKVQIQSSWFPLVDRNPHKFMAIPTADQKDFLPNTITIHRNARYMSVIQFSKLP